jgi:hypothetical protein
VCPEQVDLEFQHWREAHRDYFHDNSQLTTLDAHYLFDNCRMHGEYYLDRDGDSEDNDDAGHSASGEDSAGDEDGDEDDEFDDDEEEDGNYDNEDDGDWDDGNAP